MAHGEVAGQTTDQVGDRFCHKDAIDTKADRRQDQGQWYNDDGFSKDRKEDSMLSMVGCFEYTLTGVLESHHHKTKEVDPK